MGCFGGLLKGIGCLVVLIAAAVLGFIYRERLTALYRRVRGIPEPPPAVYVMPSPGGASQAEGALRSLARGGGPAYVDVTPEELAALIERQIAGSGHRVFDSVAVALGDQRIQVRGSLDVSVMPKRLLGPLAEGLGRREPVVAGGTLSVAPDGRLLWAIDQLKIRDFPIPRSVIGAIVRSLGVSAAPGAVVAIPLPSGIGDVRVSPSGVRVYRAAAK
jgi:hypothetical protein